jgi:hypothetical protein
MKARTVPDTRGLVPAISIVEARAQSIPSRTLLIEIAGSSPAMTRLIIPAMRFASGLLFTK